MLARRQIQVSGIVQGVGFRPYIYRIAAEHHLAGTVTNTKDGVTIEIEGPSEEVDEFIHRLPLDAPTLSRITDLRVRPIPPRSDNGFRIVSSQDAGHAHTLISPDVTVCDDCLKELFDPANRRYRYPFINCTNCGPRFTITSKVPYDRPHTSMARFKMCTECQSEYEDPLDRRFHAQPNACWRCGPQLTLLSKDGTETRTSDPLAEVIAQIGSGKIVAIRSLGGFHLVVDANDEAAVKRLRERKHRIEKPFAVMVAELSVAGRLCEVSDQAHQTLTSLERPIVILRKKDGLQLAQSVAPSNPWLGVFLPYTPLHHLLFAEGKFDSLVMTSGNISDEPIAIANEEAIERLSGIADCFLVHNRDILQRSDDSIVRVEGARAQIMRRSRGYVPAPVELPYEIPPVLAVGGQLKNTVCITRGKEAFLSQHLGDLENFESLTFFEEAIHHLKNVLEVEPAVLAHDLHPDYLSTAWAMKRAGIWRIGLQHHHAHIASCMAEHGIARKVIGISLDGTGYGTDGNIWGGEVMVADLLRFERAAHLEYVPMPGGEAAIHEPWRMAIAHLTKIFGSTSAYERIPALRKLDSARVDFVSQMIRKNINCPLTSSCGRLFDAVAAIVGLRMAVSYEGQAAIELEGAAQASEDHGAYELSIETVPSGFVLKTDTLFAHLVEDICCGHSIPDLSRRFHNGLISAFAKVSGLLREATGLSQVCLSGGVFQNAYLEHGLRRRLEQDRFQVYVHSAIPANDGGLSLGQAIIAGALANNAPS